jgi:nicotinamidase/pyrazinamidase
MRSHLLLIDPQYDFCDLPEASWAHGMNGRVAPALPVRGAHDDLLRVASLITRASDALDAITVSLDTHTRLDIAHPGFWQTVEGAPPSPFTSIRAADLRVGRFRPRDPANAERALAYVNELERRGRYTLTVWPVHCELGTVGHSVHAAVREAYGVWEERTGHSVQKVLKGQNPWTEHYSALCAEVPDPNDSETLLRTGLIAELDRADLLLVAGEASSHCVRATVMDLLDHLPSRRAEKVVLLTDAMSPVTGWHEQADAFLREATARGAGTRTSEDALGLLEVAR